MATSSAPEEKANLSYRKSKSQSLKGVRSHDRVIHFGRIVINGREFRGDVIISENRVNGNWWRKEGHVLSVDDIKEIVDAKPEVLVVGTGYSGLMKIDPRTEEYLKSSGIELIADKTERACKVYNELSKTKRVVAALHLTC